MKLGLERTQAVKGWSASLPKHIFGQEPRPATAQERSQQALSRRDVTCQASATLDRLPLSSYAFPDLPSGAVEAIPLETAVREAVKHLEQAPFLQLQQGPFATRHDVSDSVLNNPQVWDNISETLEQRGADVVLLLLRLEPAEPECVSRRVQSNSNVMTGITSAAQQGRLESIAELLRSGSGNAEFSGRVGDCCEEDMVSQIVPFTRHSHAKRRHNVTDSSGHHGHLHQSKGACYWGVVLQSRSNANDSGCYVLKTVHSGIGDCTCVHWSLTRVRQGASFFEQLNSAWLL